MNTLLNKRNAIVAILLCIVFFMHSCINAGYSKQELTYYTDKSNYIKTSGIITGIYQYEQNPKLVLKCKNLTSHFSAPYFKINCENYNTVLKRGILGKH